MNASRWRRFQQSQRVVPRHVKGRVARWTGGCLLVLGVLGWKMSVQPLLLLGLLMGVLPVAGYVVWCLWPRWQWFVRAERLVELPCPAQQRLRLSFDDGPTPGLTDVILDLLAAHQVQASFFVLLPKAQQHADLVRRMLAEGHTVGLHGEDHRAPFFRSRDELAASLGRSKLALEALTGTGIGVYRPSHGWKNRALLGAVGDVKLKMSFWNFGVWDTDAPPSPVLLARLHAVLDAAGLLGPTEPAPLVILHDGRGDEPTLPAHAATLLEALRQFLPAVKQPQPPA